MKIASLIALLGFTPLLNAVEISPIRVRVEQVTTVDNAKFKKTQEKSLKIFVTNGTAQDIANLTVKYYFFGHGLKEHESEVMEKGERPVSVKARLTEMVETPAVTATAIEKHSTGAGGKSKGKAKAKSVAASGEKLTGYGVQVVGAGKVLADYFSEPSFREIVGGGQ